MEHVGVVFDLAPRVLTLQHEDEVIDHVIDRLRPVFPEVQFALVRGTRRRTRDGHPIAAHVRGDFDTIPEWMRQAVADSRSERRVRVVTQTWESSIPQDRRRLDTDQALITPLFAGDEFVAQLILWRAPGTQGWESGDMLLLGSLASFCGDVIRNFRLLEKLQRISMDTVRTLVDAVDQKDPYTSGHSNRVGYYAKLLATQLGFDNEQLRVLEWSALLHDVGKIGIRDDVLKKPGKLTSEEYQHIKEHPSRGYNVVRKNPHMQDAIDGVLYHHERYDGKGYPTGLKGEGIPLQARIIQIADIFDALTTTRSYRDAFHWRQALDILGEEAGTVVDPQLCSLFVQMFERLHELNPDAFEQIGRPDAELDLAGAHAAFT